MLIEAFSLSELGIFIASCCASLSGLLFALSKSRCTNIKCCCVSCDRDLLPVNPPTPRPDSPIIQS